MTENVAAAADFDTPAGRKPMSDETLAQVFASLNDYVRSHDHAGTFACCSAHAAADWVNPLLRELKRTRAELSAHHAAESADAAAGSYAGRAEAAEFERNEQRARATIAEAATTALRGQRNAAKDRAEQAEAEVARLRETVALLREGMRLSDQQRNELDEVTRSETDELLDELRTGRDAAIARAEQAEAALAEIGEPIETELRSITADDRETEFDLHNEDGCGCRREERGIYAGPWREANATPPTVLERAADEQGVRLPVDIGKLTAGADLQLTDEEFAEWTSAWQCTAPCCSEDAVEQGDGGGAGDE
jgi:hypothetical protein